MPDFSADREVAVAGEGGFTDVSVLAELARELAMDINELPVVLERFRLTEAQLADLKENRTFRKLLDGAVQAWTAAANAPERIRIEAAAYFEQVLPIITRRLGNEREGLDDVVRGARMLADVAGLGIVPAGAGAERVTINIDLGSDKLTLTHAVAPIGPVARSDLDVIEAAAVEIKHNGKGRNGAG